MSSTEEQDSADGLIRVPRKLYRPHEISLRLHRSLKRKRLNVGGLGSGKTRTMCEHINNMLIAYPGGHGILCRQDLGDLKKSAQAEFLEKVVPPEAVNRFNVNENILYYKNGSKLFFMETKTPSNFKSLEIIVYGVEEADENAEGEGKDRLMTMLDGRLRQKIFIEGKSVPVPYCGIWTYNPTTDDHWLSKLEDAPDPETEVFRSTTYDNQENLPPDYIPSLLASLAPWEVNSLIWGKRASRPKGNPVLHGFTMETHVRPLRIFQHLPIYRGWDWGYNHPCVSFAQYDPEFRRFMKLREFMGNCEKLPLFAPRVIEFTKNLVGPGFPVVDIGDPHGADQKDVGESSIEYLRIHHNIYVNHKRQKLRTGLDEMQDMILTKKNFRPIDWQQGDEPKEEARFLVDPSCHHSIAAYMGGYYRGADGKPVKDDLNDHPVDTDRYIVVHTMGNGLAFQRKKQQKRYIPRCAITGY